MCRTATSPATATALAALACAILVRSDPVPKPPSSPPSPPLPTPPRGDTSGTRRISNLQLMHRMPLDTGNHGNHDEPFSNIPPEAFTLDTETDSKRTFKKDLSQVIYSRNYIDAADVDNNDVPDAYVILVQRAEDDDEDDDDDDEEEDLGNSFDSRLSEHTLESFTTDDYEATATATPPPSRLHVPSTSASLADSWNFIWNYMQLQTPHSNSIYSNRNRESKPIDKQHVIDIFTKELGARYEPMTTFVNRPSVHNEVRNTRYGFSKEHRDPVHQHHHHDFNQNSYGTKEHYDSNKQHCYGSNKGQYDSINGLNNEQYGSDKEHYGLYEDYGTRRQGWFVLGKGRDQSGEPLLVV